MKINNSSAAADLIAQMQEAAETKPSSPGFSQSVEPQPSHSASTSAPSPVAPDPVVQEAQDTARLVLNGKVGSAEEARSRVLDAVIESQTKSIKSASQRRKTQETLKLALSDDPVVTKEIDRALLLAAMDVSNE